MATNVNMNVEKQSNLDKISIYGYNTLFFVKYCKKKIWNQFLDILKLRDSTAPVH